MRNTVKTAIPPEQDPFNFREPYFRPEDGVLFVLSGCGQAFYLPTALYQLRVVLGFTGRIAVVTMDEDAKRICDIIASDDRTDLEVIFHPVADAPGGGKGVAYAKKPMMYEASPFGRSVFLDLDTLVMSEEGLIEILPQNHMTPEVVLTQFADWVTNGTRMSERIEKWRGVKGASMVPALLSNPYPAINTGVIGFNKRSRDFFRAWSELTMRNISFICDEIACQIMYTDYPHRVITQEYNASPVYRTCRDEDVYVWHGHGFKFFKKRCGREIYMPAMCRAYKADFGKMKEWFWTIPTKVHKLLRQRAYMTDHEWWEEMAGEAGLKK